MRGLHGELYDWQKFLFDLEVVPVDEFAKKLINQGMILGTSAFVGRVEGTHTFVSVNQITTESIQWIHADVSFVNASDELDIEAFKSWREEFKNADFRTDNDGLFKVKREVEKMSKSKYNVVNPDAICEQYGADSLRLYEMFLGPLEQYKPWNTSCKLFYRIGHSNSCVRCFKVDFMCAKSCFCGAIYCQSTML